MGRAAFLQEGIRPQAKILAVLLSLHDLQAAAETYQLHRIQRQCRGVSRRKRAKKRSYLSDLNVFMKCSPSPSPWVPHPRLVESPDADTKGVHHYLKGA